MLSDNAGNPAKGGRLIKNLNRSRILELLQQEGPLSRVQLAERTGISLPAVSNLVAGLQAEDLVVRLGKGQSSGGRRPVLFAYNYQVAYVVGLDVGGTKIAGGVSDLAGNLLAERTIATFDNENGDFVSRLVKLVAELLVTAQVDLDKVLGIGIGVPGIPDQQRRLVRLAPGLVRSASSAADRSLDVVTSLSEAFGRPIWLDNDVNTILSGERWQGALQGVDNAVYVAVGTGIGAALLINGQVYRGAAGAAGEVGYSLVGRLGPIVAPDGYGPLESYAAGPGIVRRYVDRLRKKGENPSPPTPDHLTARHVAHAATQGDPIAQAVWHDTAEIIGVALANICLVTNPEVLVLGGGISRAPEHLFLQPIRRIIETLVPYPPRVLPSALGEKAGVLGAVATVLDARRNSISYLNEGVTV